MNTENTIETNNISVETLPATEQISHESTLYAEPIAHFGSFTVTNALFTSWIVVLTIIVIAIIVRISIKKIPKGIQN